jgi:protein transport protein SEC31
VVQWHPLQSTTLVAACEDDLSPLLQMWDLRKTSTPIREFLGHDKVLKFSLCLWIVPASWLS